MTFNSLSYFLFLPAVYLTFYFTSDRWRWLVLLTASYGFYASFKTPYLLAVLLMVTGISYVCGLCMAAQRDETIRRRWLWIGSCANLVVLISLKYLPAMFSAVPVHYSLVTIHSLVTIGVSYFTFQAVAYLVDIYLEVEEEPERHFGRFALYMAFFPKLLQGPIERSGDLLPQLKQPYQFHYENMRSGMLLFAWGLFKKVVVADRLALFVNTVYGDVHAYNGLPLILATYFYALQIYFDFSGYTDMALGCARLFNINLTQNFNSPYLATSVADFWRRWHISFSRWILDYIFKPLQMSWRGWGMAGTAVALLVTFLVSGVWHGASRGFVVWGGLHGIYLACSVYYKPWQKKIHKALGVEKTGLLKIWQTVVTFNLVCFAWIFFRANSLGDALYVMQHMFDGVGRVRSLLFAHGTTEIAVALVMLAVPLLVKVVTVASQRADMPFCLPIPVRWSAYCMLALTLALFSVDSGRAFIYFQF